MKFETLRIHFLSYMFSVCCHREILLPWQRDVMTSLLYWVQNVFRLIFVLIRFPKGIANFSSLPSQNFQLRLFFFSFRYVCWEVCTASHSRKNKLRAHLKFRLNLTYVNLTNGKSSLIFSSLCQRASLISYNKVFIGGPNLQWYI